MMPSFSERHFIRAVIFTTLCVLTLSPAFLLANEGYAQKAGLPEFSPLFTGMDVTKDSANSTPSVSRIAIAVSKTIEPSGEHEVRVSGTSRDVSWSGPLRRGDLEIELRRALSAAGFKVLLDEHSNLVTRISAKQDGDLDETWVAVTVGDGSVDLHSTRSQIPKIRNIGDAPLTPAELSVMMLRLDPPAVEPEAITAADDFPFLRHVPGLDLRMENSQVSDAPFLTLIGGRNVTVDGPVTERSYCGPAPMSTIRSLHAYKDGLTQAGWEIVSTDMGMFQSTVELSAHYEKGARDLWAHLTISDTSQDIQVADPGTALSTQALARQLMTNRRVKLYGIHFDRQGVLIPSFKGSVDRLAAAIVKVARNGVRCSVVAHIEQSEGDGAAAGIAAAIHRELVSRGVPARLIDTHGVDDLPNRGVPGLPSYAYFEVTKH